MPREEVYRGRKIVVARDVTPRDEGPDLIRDVVIHPGAVVVLPVVDAGHVCLLRNYRFVVEETLWELPAGTLEAGEDPRHAAERELIEETGYRAGRWQKIGEFYASPGVMSEKMHLFAALDLTPGESALEDGEELEPEVVPWHQALTWAVDGTIRDAKTVAGLLLWDRLRQG
jgi:ADP-ribose pyrophosphatase